MKRVVSILLFFSFNQAMTLKELVKKGLVYNQNFKSTNYIIQSKVEKFKSVSNIYKPEIKIGLSYNRLDFDKRVVQIGETTTSFIKFKFNVYDGGRNRGLKEKYRYAIEAEKYKFLNDKKNFVFSIITLYFNLKSIEESLKIYKSKNRVLQLQYEREESKYRMQLSSIDKVLKFKTELELNSYKIQELKYQKLELLQQIKILTGVSLKKLETDKIKTISKVNYQEGSNIKMLETFYKMASSDIKIANSLKKVQILVEDSFNFYNYNDYNNRVLTDLPSQQNQFSISIVYNLFDTSSKGEIEEKKLLKLSKKNQLIFNKNSAKIEFELARERLKIQQQKIKSLKTAVKMANNLYEIVKEKYKQGLVDNITYLDALSTKVYNLSLYRQALNDLEIAKADFYLKAGVDYKNLF